MLNLCEHSSAAGFTHFLYGGNPGVADDLKEVEGVTLPMMVADDGHVRGGRGV